MYSYCDYYPYEDYASMETKSYVRLFHASPDAPPVDIYINNRLTASNLKFKDFTEYLPLESGLYNVKVYPAGKKNNPVLDRDIRIPARGIYTVAAINRLKDLALYPILDEPKPIPSGKVYVRFGHLSPNAPAVDVRLPNGQNIFKDVKYKEVTDYVPVNPGTYTFEVYPTGTNKRVLYVPNITLKGDRFYTIYAVGLVGEEPPLQVVVPLDGNSYIRV
ncbi:DUF4397 domain-containing protein [Dethiothermospora halolimnae]|uniref:DUF4397 domain-containing protein n=1 Tax=Dethiothermospora halolimnae TaxID=3114390 RepID=UPI003CCBDF75